jgi:hypothetical protein
MSAASQAAAARALRDLVRQTTIAHVGRRAALLHLDRLPPALAKPHHHRLARTALASLAERDHAQSFDLPLNRLAIVWRCRGTEEVDAPMAALEHLLADMPQGQDMRLGHVLSLFDLPQQGPWLLDTLAEGGETAQQSDLPGLDATLLAQLETSLAQADITQFLRWHPVMDIERDPPRLAWEERTLCWPTLAALLCPGRNPMDGTWLARRLARFVDRRVLAAMTGPRELSGTRPFALDVSVASLLSPVFLAFDAALPAALRGHVVLCLEAADILADATAFCFARNFARAKAYRLLLRGALPGLLNPDQAQLDYLEMPLTPSLQADPSQLPDRARLVLGRIEDAPALAWARAQGCQLVKGGGVQA